MVTATSDTAYHGGAAAVVDDYSSPEDSVADAEEIGENFGAFSVASSSASPVIPIPLPGRRGSSSAMDLKEIRNVDLTRFNRDLVTWRAGHVSPPRRGSSYVQDDMINVRDVKHRRFQTGSRHHWGTEKAQYVRPGKVNKKTYEIYLGQDKYQLLFVTRFAGFLHAFSHFIDTCQRLVRLR